MLKEILVRILSESENNILEMAFDRKQLMNKITDQSLPLLNHILNILYFQTYSDWDQTIADIYERIYDLIKIKKHRKLLDEKKLFELLFEKPFVDGDEEDTDQCLIDDVYAKEKSKKMKVKHIPTYKEVEKIYKVLTNKLWNKKFLDRDDIREIIKI